MVAPSAVLVAILRVKHKIWPNNTQRALHPSQKTWRKTTFTLARSNQHERHLASKPERDARKASSASASAGEALEKLKNLPLLSTPCQGHGDAEIRE